MEDASSTSFWCQVIPAGKEAMLEFGVASTLVITNACLGEWDGANSDPVRLTANVKTMQLGDACGCEEEDQTECGYTEQVATVCVLTPGKVEHAHLGVIFSTLNSVEMKNEGAYDIHLSGFLEDNEELWFEEEEEEAVEETETKKE